MDIEDLNKTQFLLLTLLVNFVTSIATGVLTVSLLDDTSPTITQTVNRIVERTVDTVIEPAPTLPPVVTSPSPSTEERRTQAIAEAADRRAVIYRSSSASEQLASGTYLPKARAIVSATEGLPSEIVVVFPDGSSAPASRSKSGSGIVVYGFADGATIPEAVSPTLIAKSDITLGESVVGITADGSVVSGIVTKVDATLISANVSGIAPGGSLVDLDGDIVGFAKGAGAFIPADIVTALLTAPAS